MKQKKERSGVGWLICAFLGTVIFLVIAAGYGFLKWVLLAVFALWFIPWFITICVKLYRHEWLVEPDPVPDWYTGDRPSLEDYPEYRDAEKRKEEEKKARELEEESQVGEENLNHLHWPDITGKVL